MTLKKEIQSFTETIISCMKENSFRLLGDVPSKKNWWKVARTKKGVPYIYKANKVTKWEFDNIKLLKEQYKDQALNIDKVALVMHLKYYRDKDSDNMLQTLQDIIGGVILVDDSQIRGHMCIYTKVDKKEEAGLEFQLIKF